MRAIYITGASGVIGSSLALHFATAGDRRVFAVGRTPCPTLPAGHPGQKGVTDLFDAKWLEPGDPDATIVHCAGLANPRQEFRNFAELSRDHILPHIDMLERMLERGWCGRLIFFSSGGAIYGDTLELPIRETHPTNPKSFYGLHKLCLERAFIHMAQTHGFELVILRVANPYGSHVRKPQQGVIPILLNRIEKDRPFRVIGDGTAERDYIEMSDLCDAVTRTIALNMQHRRAIILNIGSGIGTSLNDLIAIMEEITGKTLIKFNEPVLHDVQSNVLDCHRARNVLNWQPQTALESGLRKLIGERHVHNHQQ
ncbi:NAD-dependent epimerase/dehydratase family protein [Aliiroseovarius sp.]|uniref:NAD-dependent epimerase/dehydratase family protein n=1 Tax=Aliiroseovarius sp. TaxID=1872442 RepID=UPI00263015C4|nr:NAD-dependent epimerase/dehydratase family protein [Aliiroseovarius sp.]